jgi:Domain of unknown function (DUF4440)
MKSCPTCSKTFTDPNLSFCIDDGTPLVTVAEPEDETTVVLPSAEDREGIPSATEVYKPRDWQAHDYQPPGFQTPTVAPAQRKTWPWVVGILAAVVMGAIAVGIGGLLIYKLLTPDPRRSSSNPPVEPVTHPNSNLNSNAPVSNSNNRNSDTPIDQDDATPPPTDKDAVLAALLAVEQEWTVANIHADKAKLERILADDYVGVSGGKSQGKAEYLSTITPDTGIRDWKFEDLNVDVMRDRATLQGVLRLQLSDQETAFRFADKFVWRDGRWQAVSSEVSQLK